MLKSLKHQGATTSAENIYNLGWLSTSIVHDLRNPLGTIYAGATVLMDQDSTPAQVKRLAGNIYRAASRMRDLLADLTNVASRNGSTAEICDLREVIAMAWEAMGSQNVQILLDAPEVVKTKLVRSRIERVFVNLIANSVEAMPDGGEIRIGVRKAFGCALVAIEDTGPGIPCRIRDRLFVPFVTEGKANGLGLGLALCRHTILDHGGDMWAEPAAGARFVIRLPLEPK
jgi:two-component system, NtrC family, sensor histidine kinase HydH